MICAPRRLAAALAIVLSAGALSVAGAPAPATALDAARLSSAPATSPQLLPDAPGVEGPVRLGGQLATLLGTDVLDDTALAALAANGPAAARGQTPPVGTTRLWPTYTLSFSQIVMTLRPFTLRAVGSTIEAWVASGNDLIAEGNAFPAGDCRNARPDEIEISDAQIEAMVGQFDSVIHPRLTRALSVLPPRDGSNSLPPLTAAGLDFTGSGERTVMLVENIRDPNFYAIEEGGVAGFVSSRYGLLTDRNIVTVDSFDWKHLTGANPPDEPGADRCTSRRAVPRFHEATLAHEWAHLLQFDQSAEEDEPIWVFEGMAEYASFLAGYILPLRTPGEVGADSFLLCYHGFGTVASRANPVPRACGGPQNSLTVWGEEIPPGGTGRELAADYGNASGYMLYLAGRFGPAVLRALHRDGERQGLDSLQAALDAGGHRAKVGKVLQGYRFASLLDRALDRRGGRVQGVAKRVVTAKNLNAALNLANPAANALPGVFPNGADFVRPTAGGALIAAKDLRSLSFQAAPTPDPGLLALLDEQIEVVGEPGTWRVDLVGFDPAGSRALVRSWTPDDTLNLTRRQLKPFAAFPVVVVIVGYDLIGEDSETPGRYALTVNGVTQPGG